MLEQFGDKVPDPRLDEVARGLEFVDHVIADVRNVNVAGRVNRQENGRAGACVHDRRSGEPALS